MPDVNTLIRRFSEKVQFAVDRAQYCADPAYFDGLESYVLGGEEIQGILEYANISKAHKQEIASLIREQCLRLYEESGIIRHALNKPHGYAGDYEILECIYDLQPHKDTATDIGITIDKWALSLSLPRAVRSRKNAIYFWLYEYGLRAKAPLKVLSIGAGSARELRELPDNILRKLDVTLIDRDENALAFAKHGLLEKVPKLNLTLIRDSFHRVQISQKFDVIYSFGVFDYLVDRVIANCFKKFSPHLEEGGKFIYSIKNSQQYQDWFYDIFTDWRFVNRCIDDGKKLATDSGYKVVDMCRLESDVAAVYVCEPDNLC